MHRFPVRISFEHADISGIVHHANDLRHMKRARSDLLGVIAPAPELLTEAMVRAGFLTWAGRPRRQPAGWVEKSRIPLPPGRREALSPTVHIP
ncbi:MAG: hypothetical protein ACRC1J_01220 [Sandaracinobacteroides sp.]